MNTNSYVYSPSANAFYPVDLKVIYEAAGSWPDDAIDVKDSVYDEFVSNYAPQGKERAAGEDGYPIWIDAAKID